MSGWWRETGGPVRRSLIIVGVVCRQAVAEAAAGAHWAECIGMSVRPG